MYMGLHVKYPLFSSDFNETCSFRQIFEKNTKISNFMKILPVAAESFHVDRHEANSRFSRSWELA